MFVYRTGVRGRELQEDNSVDAGAEVQPSRLAEVPHEWWTQIRLQQQRIVRGFFQ